jgi:hypothetical protein
MRDCSIILKTSNVIRTKQIMISFSGMFEPTTVWSPENRCDSFLSWNPVENYESDNR